MNNTGTYNNVSRCNQAGAPDPARPVVLIIATAFPPDALSGAARPGRFARYLTQFGYEPVVLCQSSPESPTAQAPVVRVPPPTPGRKARALANFGAFVQRYLLPYNDSLPWAAHALIGVEEILSCRSVAAVLSTSPPIATHLVGLWVKLRHGLPWVADFRDPLWGNPFRTRRWPFPYDPVVERLLFRHSDALIANTDTTAELWCRRHRDIAHKVEVIWNGFDPEDRVEVAPPTAGERRVLAHVGSIYGGRHPGLLFASLVRLIRRGELSAGRVRVCLVGPVEEGCLRMNREDVETLRDWGCLDFDGKSVPVAEARRASTRSDYLLLLDINDHEADLQIPAKLFEYILIGRPILAFTRRDSPTDRILRKSGVPHRVVYAGAGDDEVDREVRSLFELSAVPATPSAWFEEQFNGRNQTQVLAGILDRVRGRSPRSPALTGAGDSCTDRDDR